MRRFVQNKVIWNKRLKKVVLIPQQTRHLQVCVENVQKLLIRKPIHIFLSQNHLIVKRMIRILQQKEVFFKSTAVIDAAAVELMEADQVGSGLFALGKVRRERVVRLEEDFLDEGEVFLGCFLL